MSCRGDLADATEVMTSTSPAHQPSRAGALLAAIALSGCGTLDYTQDLASNELFYVDVSYTTAAPGDVEVFVAPVDDQRDADALPRHDRGFPIRYGGDDFWERPVVVMVDEILRRQLTGSRLFAAIADRAGPETVVVRPSLVRFVVGAQEGVSGSMTFAEVGLRLEVLGPVGADGERPRWHDRVYGNRQRTEHQVSPVSPYRLIGRALQVTISEALSGLDGSNVARSSVPAAGVSAGAARHASPAR